MGLLPLILLKAGVGINLKKNYLMVIKEKALSNVIFYSGCFGVQVCYHTSWYYKPVPTQENERGRKTAY